MGEENVLKCRLWNKYKVIIESAVSLLPPGISSTVLTVSGLTWYQILEKWNSFVH